MKTGGANSARYILFATLGSRVVLLVGGVILVRLLEVEDFGYLLTLKIIFGFINLFSLSGYEYYYIQERELEGTADDWQLLRQVFNLRVLQSAALFVITLIVGYVFVQYRDPVLGKLLMWTAPVHLLALIAKPEESYHTKRLRFREISIAKVAKDITNSLAKIIAALFGAGPFSFVIGNLAGSVSYGGTLKVLGPVKLLAQSKWRSRVKPYGEIRRFGFHLFLNTGGAYLKNQLDKIFVSELYPIQQKGLYQFSTNYAAYPFNSVVVPQTQMVLSLMSKHKDNPAYLLKLFRAYGILVGIFIVPLMLLVLLEAPTLITLVFGAKWVAAAPVFQVFVVYYLYAFINFPANGILTALGKPQIKGRYTLTGALISGVLLLVLGWVGAELTFYAAAFVFTATLVDLACGFSGFRLLKGEKLKYGTFLLDRLKQWKLYAGILSAFLILSLFETSINQWTRLGLLTTIILIMIYAYARLYKVVVRESVVVFVKSPRLLKFMERIL